MCTWYSMSVGDALLADDQISHLKICFSNLELNETQEDGCTPLCAAQPTRLSASSRPRSLVGSTVRVALAQYETRNPI